jgi:hypothetical protein
MKNQLGFIGIGVLVAILVILTIIGGGAYYLTYQQPAQQTATDNLDSLKTLPTSNTQPNTQTATNSTSATTSTSFAATSAFGTRGQPVTFSTSYGGQHDAQTAYYVDFGNNRLRWFSCANPAISDLTGASTECLPAIFQYVYPGSGEYSYTVTLHRVDIPAGATPQPAYRWSSTIVGTTTVAVSGTDTLPPPTCTLTASPTAAVVGQMITISWNAKNADDYGLGGTGAWVGMSPGSIGLLDQMKTIASLSGSQTVTAEKAGSETLGFEVSGPGGDGTGKCSVTVTASQSPLSVSVPGMSTYTDPDFGFSFGYPSAWALTQISVQDPSISGTIVKTFKITDPSGQNGFYVEEITSSSGSITVPTAGCSTTYSYTNQWMGTIVGCDGAGASSPAQLKTTTMGGLPAFDTQAGLSSDGNIVPLSTGGSHWVLVNWFGSINLSATPLTNTIVTTSETPVSGSKQTATLQAEQQAYAGQ